MNIGVYIYNQAEVLDFAGPFEVFSTASRICSSGHPFTVFTVGETGETITARGGLSVNPAYGFDNHPQIDVLIVAGGMHSDEIQKANVLDWVYSTARTAQIIASVCTGVFLLAEARCITTQHVTTHWDDISDLQKNYPGLQVQASKRWVEDGDVVTSAGISAGIDMSLYLVSILYNMTLATKTAGRMEFGWTGNSASSPGPVSS